MSAYLQKGPMFQVQKSPQLILHIYQQHSKLHPNLIAQPHCQEHSTKIKNSFVYHSHTHTHKDTDAYCMQVGEPPKENIILFTPWPRIVKYYHPEPRSSFSIAGKFR